MTVVAVLMPQQCQDCALSLVPVKISDQETVQGGGARVCVCVCVFDYQLVCEIT